MFLLALRNEKLLFNGAHGDNGEYTILTVSESQWKFRMAPAFRVFSHTYTLRFPAGAVHVRIGAH